MKKSRLISLALCICMVMSLLTGFTASASADDVITHTVVNGDYLFKVCKSYGLDYYQCKQAIMALNGFTSDQQLNHISVGQLIKLPASNAVAATVKATTTTTTTVTTATTVSGVTTTTSSTSTVVGTPAADYNVEFYLVPHKIASGETLNSICNALGTSYYQYSSIINAANGITNVNNIKAGANVYIPTNVVPSAGSFYSVVAHQVSSGETVTSICSKYGTNYESNKTLVNGLNSSVNLNKIYANQKLLIPVIGSRPSSSSTVPGVPAPTAAPTAETFQLSFNNPANGDPSATVGSNKNATRACAGDKVIINANADAGYAIASVKATRTDSGANLKITDNTFVMPKSDVAISVSYAKGLTIKKTKSPGGSFDTLVGGTPGTSAFYGDLVTLVLNPSDNYVLDKSTPPTYQKADGSFAAVEIKDDDKDGFYTFKMPNYNVQVKVTYKLAEYHTLTANTIAGQGSAAFYVKDKAVTKAVEEDVIKVKLSPAKNYVADSAAILADNSGLKNLKQLSANEYSFEMETSNVEFKVTFKNAAQYKLTAKEVTGGSVKFNVQDAATGKWTYSAKTAKEGDFVQISVTASTKYVFDSTTGISVTYSNTSSKVLPNFTSGPYEFTMPGADVTVTPAFKADDTAVKYKVSISCGNHGKFIVIDSSGLETHTFASGEDITLDIRPDANYSLKEVIIKDSNGKNITADVSYDATAHTFTMPAKAVTVAVTFKSDIQYVMFGVNYDNTYAAVRMMVNGKEIADNASVGSFVYLDIQPKDGYEIYRVDFDGKEISKNSDGKYGHTVTEADYAGHEYDSGTALKFAVSMQPKEVPVYTIMYSTPAHGDYSINGTKDNVVDAKADDTIKIVVSESDIESGYKLGKIIVDGLEVSSGDIVHDSGEYRYSFIMPARDVVTKVTFAEAE